MNRSYLAAGIIAFFIFTGIYFTKNIKPADSAAIADQLPLDSKIEFVDRESSSVFYDDGEVTENEPEPEDNFIVGADSALSQSNDESGAVKNPDPDDDPNDPVTSKPEPGDEQRELISEKDDDKPEACFQVAKFSIPIKEFSLLCKISGVTKVCPLQVVSKKNELTELENNIEVITPEAFELEDPEFYIKTDKKFEAADKNGQIRNLSLTDPNAGFRVALIGYQKTFSKGELFSISINSKLEPDKDCVYTSVIRDLKVVK